MRKSSSMMSRYSEEMRRSSMAAQGDVKYGDIPVDSSREVFEAVKGIR
jgi:hypothetical protein